MLLYSRIKSIIISLLFLLFKLNGIAQGCSDAGICSIGGMKSGSGSQIEDSLNSRIGISQLIAIGEQFELNEQYTWIYTTQFE
ncbi:MAG: hypothetical protein ABEH43_06475 [Flavobacteriales bacterium]